MTCWRDRLAAIRARHVHADSAESANNPTAAAIGTIGTNGTDMESAEAAAAVAARAAFYARFQAEAAAALAEREPDPIEEAERVSVFGAPHARVDGEFCNALKATP